MPALHVLILGAGPCGLSTAIALSQASTAAHPLRVTVIEIRGDPQGAAGGAVNLTPLALRYLDQLGAGSRVRARACRIDAVDVVSMRTGRRLGSLWRGHDLVRANRRDVVLSLVETVRDEHAHNVELLYGRRARSVVEVAQTDDTGEEEDNNINSSNNINNKKKKIILELENGAETLEGDLLLGCDGLHSFARREYVDPDRREVYTGRSVVIGYADALEGERRGLDITLAGGSGEEPALTGTTMIHGSLGGLLVSYFEPTKSQVYLGATMEFDEPKAVEDARDGWRAVAGDAEAIRSDTLRRWRNGKLGGIQDLVARCKEWSFFPVYALAPGGRWSRGRVMLLGDAAHAMPPQGESTGIAIEDGILLAHVFQRRGAGRSIEQMFADHEQLRRPVVDRHYRSAKWRWDGARTEDSYARSLLIEWLTLVLLTVAGWFRYAPFESDVRQLKLPE
ncbi:hypothetical protein BX600DRAFT_436200 [Xylariales sp. PMI_506]|nr:hypothetical protein BX600DRAFT_436200 [Xylariales sp. PMI_506]